MRGPPTKVKPFAFPFKGLDTSQALADQPPGTSCDLQNVRAFPVDGRLRGGVRPGTAKAFATALAGPVDRLVQAALAGTAQAGLAATETVRDHFTSYTDATLLKNGSGGLWGARSASGAGTDYFDALASATDPVAMGTIEDSANDVNGYVDFVSATSSVANPESAFFYRTSALLTRTLYRLEIQYFCAFEGTGKQFGLSAHVNHAAAGTSGIHVTFDDYRYLRVYDGTTLKGTYDEGGSRIDSTWLSLRIERDGDTFTFYLDGVARLQFAVTTEPSYSGIGFGITKTGTAAFSVSAARGLHLSQGSAIVDRFPYWNDSTVTIANLSDYNGWVSRVAPADTYFAALLGTQTAGATRQTWHGEGKALANTSIANIWTNPIDVSSGKFTFRARVSATFTAGNLSYSWAYVTVGIDAAVASIANTVTASVEYGSDGGGGFVLRYVRLYTGSTLVATYDAGTGGLGTVNPYAYLNWLELRLDGTDCEVWFKGVQRITHTLASAVTTGTFAWGGHECYEINLYATEPDSLAPLRDVYLAATAGGNIYSGRDADLVLSTNGTAALGNYARQYPTAAWGQGAVYFTDGVNYKKLDLLTNTVTSFAATSGTIPPNCKLIAVWRDRIILAGDADNPQNVYASASGDYLDWSFGGTTATSAWSLNAADAGRIGEPILALIPFGDGELLLCGDHSIYAMVNDPTFGGAVVPRSTSIGVYGPDAWCMDPAGAVYFVGTGGLFKIEAGGGPVNISGPRMRTYFNAIDRSAHHVQLAYDRDADGIYIFATPRSDTVQHTSMYYDVALDAFFPDEFPAEHGPDAVYVYDGDEDADRFVLLGGRDGYVRKVSKTATGDDGIAISAHALIGPLQPFGPLDMARLDEVEAVMSTDTTSVSYDVRTGPDAEAAKAAAAEVTSTWAAGRNDKQRTRARANTFYLKLYSSALTARWALERLLATFTYGGRLK